MKKQMKIYGNFINTEMNNHKEINVIKVSMVLSALQPALH